MIFNCTDLHLWKNWRSLLNWVCVIFNSRDKFFLCILQDVAESVSLVLDFALFCFLLCFFHFSSFSRNEDHSCFVVASKTSCRNVL
jgi:hypothetical protein